jgi:RNA polymerase sigma-70 factor (ECF subfamily)
MLKVRAGDLEKLGLLYKRYSRRLFGFFYQMTKSGAVSEDLVQNVFMRMLKYKHTYSENGTFETWAFQLARNVHHDHYQKNKKYLLQETMNDWDNRFVEHSNYENRTENQEQIDQLRLAINALSPEKKELIELVRFQNLKYAQVAIMVGITEGALKVRIHRILKELRDLYEKIDANN